MPYSVHQITRTAVSQHGGAHTQKTSNRPCVTDWVCLTNSTLSRPHTGDWHTLGLHRIFASFKHCQHNAQAIRREWRGVKWFLVPLHWDLPKCWTEMLFWRCIHQRQYRVLPNTLCAVATGMIFLLLPGCSCQNYPSEVNTFTGLAVFVVRESVAILGNSVVKQCNLAIWGLKWAIIMGLNIVHS